MTIYALMMLCIQVNASFWRPDRICWIGIVGALLLMWRNHVLNVACMNLVFQNQSRTTSIKPNKCSVGLNFLYKSSKIMLRRDFKWNCGKKYVSNSKSLEVWHEDVWFCLPVTLLMVQVPSGCHSARSGRGEHKPPFRVPWQCRRLRR